MSRKDIEERVEQIATELLKDDPGFEVVDVEYTKEHQWCLRVFIDKEGGIDIEDCQELSPRIEEELDRQDFIPESYVLEVSSPGLDRVLRKERDFRREIGKQVDVSLYAPKEGKKELVGKLTAFDGDSFALDDKMKILMSEAAQVRLHIDI